MADKPDAWPGIEFPGDLEVSLSRDFTAPIELVFDVLTKEEHARTTFAPFDEEVVLFEHDFRVGGDYHYVMVTPDGIDCSFRGRFLEIDPPNKSMQTWHFDGWPDADAVETFALQERDGVTTLTWTLAFSDQAGRDRMASYDGILANFNNIAGLVDELTAAG